MVLLLWHCRSLSYKDRRPSKRPRGIRAVLLPRRTEAFANVVAVMACVERGDSAATVREAAESVCEMAARVVRRDVVVVPFAHLLEKDRLETDSEKAVALLRSLVEAIGATGLSVTATSFGYDKDFRLSYDSYGHAGAVGYRHFGGSAHDPAGDGV